MRTVRPAVVACLLLLRLSVVQAGEFQNTDGQRLEARPEKRSEKRSDQEKPTSRTLRKIEGWTVRVDDRLSEPRHFEHRNVAVDIDRQTTAQPQQLIGRRRSLGRSVRCREQGDDREGDSRRRRELPNKKPPRKEKPPHDYAP